METSEILSQAITITCEKATHNNSHAPAYQVNAQVAHWRITEVRVNDVDFYSWCESHDFASDWLYIGDEFKTKKAALPFVIEQFERVIELCKPEMIWDDQDFYNKLIEALKADK